jgi:hypothetical protein
VSRSTKSALRRYALSPVLFHTYQSRPSSGRCPASCS